MALEARKPTIYFVSHWDWVLYNFRLPIVDALLERGFDVRLSCPQGDYVRSLLERGYRWEEWAVTRRGVRLRREMRSLCQLASRYRRAEPVLVHHFTIKPILYGSAASLVIPSTAVVNTFSGLGSMFGAKELGLRGTRFALIQLFRVLSRRNNVWTTCQNEEDGLLLCSTGMAKPHRLRVIEGSGVDTEIFKPRAGGANRQLCVVMASRLIVEKGVKEFVALARLLRDHPARPRFVHVGGIDPGNPHCISHAQLEQWRDDGHVEFLGHRNDMLAVLGEADVAVLPTYYREGVPRFLLEAASCGLPIVATDYGPCQAAVVHDKSGFLVPPQNVSELGRAVRRLLEEPGLRKRFGTEGRRLIESRHQLSRVVDEYLELYRAAGLQV